MAVDRPSIEAGVKFHSIDGFSGFAASEDMAARFAEVLRTVEECSQSTVVAYDSRQVRRLKLPDGTVVYAKIIYALTDAGWHGTDPFSFLKWVGRPSRAIGIWYVSQKLRQAGFACAEPVIAARRRSWWGYPTDIIVTAEVRQPDLWQRATEMPMEKLLDRLSRETARLHHAGFAHGDYILRNLCWDDSTEQIVLLDNDRTWQVPAFLRGHYQRRNLAQMCYSLIRRFKAVDTGEKFLKLYCNANPAVLSERQAAAIVARCTARAKKYLS